MKGICNALIVGAGEAGRIVLRELRARQSEHIAGFIDDDPAKKGHTIDGVPVLGGRELLADSINNLGISRVYISLPSAHAKIISDTISMLLELNPLPDIRVLPGTTRFFNELLLRNTRKVQFADLVRRDEAEPEIEAISTVFEGKTVLVTGAGGSIGSELCRQLCRFGAGLLVCLGRGENSIYELAADLEAYAREYGTHCHYEVCDVTHKTMLKRVFETYQPQLVIHAAAHKHVPLMERQPAEAVRNNIGGTDNVLSLSLDYSVERFVLISTDKAVRPTNIMGATKRVAELLVRHYRAKGLPAVAVRFGNVFGSRGSVVPLFQQQIERGGPVTVTHPEMTRYFMSIPEAALLVLNAAVHSAEGEIFVLDMGQPFRIDEIARRMIAMFGLEAGRDIAIEYTGIRPGEKMYEELYYDRQDMTATTNSGIFVLHEQDVVPERLLNEFMRAGFDSSYQISDEIARQMLRNLVPTLP